MRQPTRSSISAALRRLRRPAGTFDAARYFRGDHGLRFYNVGTPHVRALAREIVRANPEWGIDEAMRLADDLLRDPYLETKSVGIEVVARFRQSFEPQLLAHWKRWLADDYSANWATTDAICSLLIGPLLTRHPPLIPRLRRWVTHSNLWVRRAAIVALIPVMRRGLALDQVYETATTLRPDRHDLIHKAVGWALREAGKQDPARLERYLRTAGPTLPRTTLRYAIERFPPAERRALLAGTREPARGVTRRITAAEATRRPGPRAGRS
jgi:3-methyladenine DNA glycosylase AlkD